MKTNKLRRFAGVKPSEGKLGIRGACPERESKGNPEATRGISTSRADDLARHTKRRGELAEAAFLAKAASMGIGVAKPWGDSERYDFIIDAGGRPLKVQIKSAHCVNPGSKGGYNIRAQPRRDVSYRADEIDLLIAYIVPLDIWYVFPPEAFVRMSSIQLVPNSIPKRSRHEQYREAWEWVYRVGSSSREAAKDCSPG